MSLDAETTLAAGNRLDSSNVSEPLADRTREFDTLESGSHWL